MMDGVTVDEVEGSVGFWGVGFGVWDLGRGVVSRGWVEVEVGLRRCGGEWGGGEGLGYRRGEVFSLLHNLRFSPHF